MKTIVRFALLAVIACAAQQGSAVVGYYNYTFYYGDNLFQNNLQSPDNHLSTLFPSVPDGTTVSLWDSGANAYGTTAMYSDVFSAWVDPDSFSLLDFELLPGTGARLTSPSMSPFNNTFVGDVVMRDGGPFVEPFPPPPPFSGPNGTYLMGDISPVASTGTDVFLNILGRLPNIGDQFTRLDAATQVYTTSTYLGAGAWDTVLPFVNVGDAAFFTIPEPSLTALGLLGIALFRFRKR